jgi:hypothetical protein
MRFATSPLFMPVMTGIALAQGSNVLHLLEHPRFELMRHDVTFPLYVEVDEIYNLAYLTHSLSV